MSDSDQWRKDLIAYHVTRLGILYAKPADEIIPCPVCASTDARGKELCGCDQQSTVADAIRFHVRELEMIGAGVR